MTRELLDKILDMVAAGNYTKTAVMANDVYEGTYYRWIERGEADGAAGRHTLYSELCESSLCARAKAQTYHVGLILRNAEAGKDGRTSLEFLARTDPANWARDRSPTESSKAPAASIDALLSIILSELEDDPDKKRRIVERLEMMSR